MSIREAFAARLPKIQRHRRRWGRSSVPATLSHRKRDNSRQGASANIISDGCRDYVVSMEHENNAELLRHWTGRVRRFASIADAKRAIRRANVADIRLSIRVAADEACAGDTLQDSGFATVPLARISSHNTNQTTSHTAILTTDHNTSAGRNHEAQ